MSYDYLDTRAIMKRSSPETGTLWVKALAPSRGLSPRYPRLRTAPCGEARGFAPDLLAKR
jgi:hypothetical protein